MQNVRRRQARIILVMVALVILLVSVFIAANWSTKAVYPRTLQVGDLWVYRITFPDGNEYVLTETVHERLEINGSLTYVIFGDDEQHISTNYMWLTYDWHEIKLIKPHIGNLQASSVTIFQPPIELIHFPLRVGDGWDVNSTSITTITSVGNRTQITSTVMRETRQIVSFDQINTPAGSFQAFKVEVVSSGLPFETIWFSSQLGQFVYAEFHNPLGEIVTQNLLSYALTGWASNSTSHTASSSSVSVFGENITEVISTTNPKLFDEMKISYD